MGHSWVVVGIGHCVVVGVGGVVGLWLWLVEERSDVTSCDINVMFKLTHEITCTISHNFPLQSPIGKVGYSEYSCHLPSQIDVWL